MARTRRLLDNYGPGKIGLSFELFPPKTPEGETDLFQNLRELVAFGPSFITCTYGAGGSTRDKTLDIAGRVKREFGLPVASHLTCVGATADDLRQYLREARDRDIDYIVALRGDPPKGEEAFRVTEGGYAYACELVGLLRAEFPEFDVAVAGYPEMHPEAVSLDADIDNLKRKIDCGADIVITQLFYSNARFLEFRDRCAGAGINAPIVPGLLPVTNLTQVKRITSMCGAHLPEEFQARLEASEGQPQEQFEIGVEHASRQVEELVREGTPGVHFYVLNKSRAAARILGQMSLPESAR
ncbi:MAG: methylenetetrahydrofolate reductase [NAD(P)H] [FCB group bacterium]|jgi:methylenetetrahydrofolate reductase (NADPH)|nr:methylenetetrahydrofolate reductase [NAD(P)H] [FCB group bacterium]